MHRKQIIKGKQLTVCWYIDDLFIGHDDPAVAMYWSPHMAFQTIRHDDKKLNVVRGPHHDYLGMDLNFSTKGMVSIDMIPLY